MRRPRSATPTSRFFAMAMAGLLFWAGQAAAQTLEQVDLLTRDGRVADARAELTAWWDASWDDAGRDARQKGLWFRGVLTLDPGQAASQFRRLAAEYPGGSWSAAALLRLGQMELLAGDVLGAARYFGDLVRDYPASGARLEAAEWLDANELAIEQARLVSARGAVVPVPVGDARDVDPDPPVVTAAGSDDEDEQPVARGDWAVQLGAFSSTQRAEELAVRAQDAGFEPRVVKVGDSELVRVRVGYFDSAEIAETVYDRIVRAGFEARIVQDVAREVIGG